MERLGEPALSERRLLLERAPFRCLCGERPLVPRGSTTTGSGRSAAGFMSVTAVTSSLLVCRVTLNAPLRWGAGSANVTALPAGQPSGCLVAAMCGMLRDRGISGQPFPYLSHLLRNPDAQFPYFPTWVPDFPHGVPADSQGGTAPLPPRYLGSPHSVPPDSRPTCGFRVHHGLSCPAIKGNGK